MERIAGTAGTYHYVHRGVRFTVRRVGRNEWTTSAVLCSTVPPAPTLADSLRLSERFINKQVEQTSYDVVQSIGDE